MLREEEFPADVMQVAIGIANDIPSRVTDVTRGFAANVIARAIMAERKRHPFAAFDRTLAEADRKIEAEFEKLRR